MTLPSVLQSIVTFLRAGYPEGVPERDYQPLLALLRRQLTVDEVEQVADELMSAGDPATGRAIRTTISDVMHAEPGERDVARVRTQLAAGGWPLAALDSAGRAHGS
jgi:hypothetical protein